MEEPFALLSYQEACVFAGDIGTSPLYVMSSTFYANDGAPRPSTDDVVGVTSLIVWTITWIVVRPLMKRCHALSTHCREYEGGFALSGKHEHNMDCKWQYNCPGLLAFLQKVELLFSEAV